MDSPFYSSKDSALHVTELDAQTRTKLPQPQDTQPSMKRWADYIDGWWMKNPRARGKVKVKWSWGPEITFKYIYIHIYIWIDIWRLKSILYHSYHLCGGDRFFIIDTGRRLTYIKPNSCIYISRISFRRPKEPRQSLQRSQSLGIFHDHQATQPKTDEMGRISLRIQFQNHIQTRKTRRAGSAQRRARLQGTT